MNSLPKYKIGDKTVFMNYKQSITDETKLNKLVNFLDNEKTLKKIHDEEDFIIYSSSPEGEEINYILIIDGLTDGIDLEVSYTNGIDNKIKKGLDKILEN